MPVLALLSAAVLSTGFSGCGYNQIQTMDEAVSNQWAQVESQLQRRSDLIPNLVTVVKSYAKHEKDVFTNIADARAKLGGAIQSKDPAQVSAADQGFSSALSRLLVVAENYPQLKADGQYTRLMDELSGTENRIAVARMDYNNTVKTYNSYIRQFPNNLTAMAFHAEARKYYDPPAASQEAPVVKMD
ncbi:MAG: LemA family protein [Candidatus Melainabacteria bacterium]